MRSGVLDHADSTFVANWPLARQSERIRWSLKYHGEWQVALFFLIAGCLLGAFPIMNALRDTSNNKDYSHWYGFGRTVIAGEPLYSDVRNGEPEYMYPPTAAILFYAPLSLLGPVGFVSALSLISSLSWAFSAWASLVLARGNAGILPSWWLVLPGLAIAPYVWDIQLLGQTNLLLLALTLASFVSLRHHRPILASILFGTAVSLKAFPLSAIAYFVVRKQWSAVIATLVTIAALVWFLPGLVRGFDRNNAELHQWTSLMIADQSGETMAGRSSIGFTRRNQSLVSCSHRLLRHVDAGDSPSHPLYVNFAELAPGTAQLVGYGACLLLGLILLASCRFQFGSTPQCEGIEIAMVCTLVPLSSALAWTYFFCWLLPAWAAIASSLHNPSLSKHARRVITISASLAGLLLASAASEHLDPTLQACGVTCFGSVMLFLTLAYIRWQLPIGRVVIRGRYYSAQACHHGVA